MGDSLVRLGPAQEIVVSRLTELGIFKNKSEIIRAGIMKVGQEYGIGKTAQDVEDEMAARKGMRILEEIKAGKRKTFTAEQVKQKYGFK